jgi:hypothetical protein
MKRRSGSAVTAARSLGRGTGARATGGPESASAQARIKERQEDAGVAGGRDRRDGGEPAYRETHRRRNWSSARRTCAKARASNRGECDICRAGSACHPGRNARELTLGSRSIPRVGSQQSDLTLGSDGVVANCVRRPPPVEARLLKSGRRGKVKGGSGARRCRGEPGRQRQRTETGDGSGAQNAWRGAEAGLWEPSSRTAKRRSWRTT